MNNKKHYDTLLFDLDGTLTDPKEGITKSVAYALKHFGIEVADLDSLCKFIGPPLSYSFREYFGLSDSDIKTAINKYRENFSAVGIYQNLPYDGMDHLLSSLCGAGKTLIVATSKPTVYAEKILEKFDLKKYFRSVVGSELNGDRGEKQEVIRAALDINGVTDLERTAMIGDREYDIIGAAANGIDSVGVLFGYGSREELEKAGATRIAASVEDLATILV